MENETAQPTLKETLVDIAKKSTLDDVKKTKYVEQFTPFALKTNELIDQIKGINSENPTEADATFARDIRLQLVKNRKETEREAKAIKDEIAVETSLIQSFFKAVETISKLNEENLTAIEKHQETLILLEKEQKKSERVALLQPFVTDVAMYPLGEISQEAFENLLEGAKLIFEAKQQREELNRKKEIEAERIKKVTDERIKLLLNTGAKQNETSIELNNKDFPDAGNVVTIEDVTTCDEQTFQIYLDEFKATEQINIKHDLKLKTNSEALIAKNKKIETENARIKKELADKVQKEIDEKLAEENRIELELAKGDAEKLEDLLKDLAALKTKYAFKSKKHKLIYSNTGDLLDKIMGYINTKK